MSILPGNPFSTLLLLFKRKEGCPSQTQPRCVCQGRPVRSQSLNPGPCVDLLSESFPAPREARLTSTGPDSGLLPPELHVLQPSVCVERAQLASFSSLLTTEDLYATTGRTGGGCVSPGSSERPGQIRLAVALTPGSVHPPTLSAQHSPQGRALPFTVTWGYVGGSVWVCECEWALSHRFS